MGNRNFYLPACASKMKRNMHFLGLSSSSFKRHAASKGDANSSTQQVFSSRPLALYKNTEQITLVMPSKYVLFISVPNKSIERVPVSRTLTAVA